MEAFIGIIFVFLISLLPFIIPTIADRQRVIKKPWGDRVGYVICKGWIDKCYLEIYTDYPYWWYTYHTYVTVFDTEESARHHLPKGFLYKLVSKWKYKKVLREQEQLLKMHQEKMSKIKMDFSDYN